MSALFPLSFCLLPAALRSSSDGLLSSFAQGPKVLNISVIPCPCSAHAPANISIAYHIVIACLRPAVVVLGSSGWDFIPGGFCCLGRPISGV